MSAAQGSWTIERWELDPAMDPSRRALAEAYARGLVMKVDGAKITLSSNGATVERSVSVRQVGPDSFVASLGADSALVKVDGDRMTVTSRAGLWRGVVVLRRAR